jgi:hypothetical protein
MSSINQAGGRRSPSSTGQSDPNPTRREPQRTRPPAGSPKNLGVGHVNSIQPPDLQYQSDGDSGDDEYDDDGPRFDNAVKTKAERASERRNSQRILLRDADDEKTLSKYLPPSIDVVLGPPVPGPDDNFVPPDWLTETINEIAKTDPQSREYPRCASTPVLPHSTTMKTSSSSMTTTSGLS